MTTLQVHVGLGLDEMGDLFASAFKRADAGEPVNERHLSFTSLADLARALTPARLALLRHLHQLRVGDVRQLATALGCDYEDADQDVRMLEERGLIHRDNAIGLRTDFDEIRFDVRIAL